MAEGIDCFTVLVTLAIIGVINLSWILCTGLVAVLKKLHLIKVNSTTPKTPDCGTQTCGEPAYDWASSTSSTSSMMQPEDQHVLQNSRRLELQMVRNILSHSAVYYTEQGMCWHVSRSCHVLRRSQHVQEKQSFCKFCFDRIATVLPNNV